MAIELKTGDKSPTISTGRSLPQTPESPQPSGKHASGRGRPLIPDTDKQKRRNINLSDRLAAKAHQIGNGNISVGIRRAITTYMGVHHDGKKPMIDIITAGSCNLAGTCPPAGWAYIIRMPALPDGLVSNRVYDTHYKATQAGIEALTALAGYGTWIVRDGISGLADIIDRVVENPMVRHDIPIPKEGQQEYRRALMAYAMKRGVSIVIRWADVDGGLLTVWLAGGA